MPLDIFPYQEEGAAYLAPRTRAGLFDEMGVGKTAQAIRALDLRRVKRGIIICPASLRQNWINEFEKFAVIPRRIVKGESRHDLILWLRGRADTLVVSYELATKWAPAIHEICEPFDFLICDEFHYLKDPKSQRTKAILGPECDGNDGLLQWAVQAWFLTGTALPNDPVDIFPFLKAVGAMPLDLPGFKHRYFFSRQRTYGSAQTPRAAMVDELRNIIGNNSIRRTKAQIGVQLPPIFLTTAVVDGDLSEIQQMLREHPGLDKAILHMLDMDFEGGEAFGQKFEHMAEYIATLRRLIGEAKSVPYGHMLIDELNGGLDKRVVFGIHRKALINVRDMVARAGYGVVLINGDTKEAERVAAVKAFQTDPRCKVFIGNIRAAGVGLTLTAANTLDMMESDWTPAGNAQAIMRIHRLGQVRNVTGRFITLAKSLDETVIKVVVRKTQAIAEIEGDEMISAPASCG
jgi:SWI/SNF-related matrix-associated actin-dependent regulator 1 of chromatin subfamily A